MAINKTIEQTKRRFDMYGKQGLYCGEDGLPHLVTSGDWNHAGEFMVRSLRPGAARARARRAPRPPPPSSSPASRSCTSRA